MNVIQSHSLLQHISVSVMSVDCDSLFLFRVFFIDENGI